MHEDNIEQRLEVELPATALTRKNVLKAPNLLALVDSVRDSL